MMPPDSIVAVHLFVTGKVQGVGLRRTVAARATELGVTGWIGNCRSGGVQMHLEGPRDTVTRLAGEIQAGLGNSVPEAASLVHTRALGHADFTVSRGQPPAPTGTRDAVLDITDTVFRLSRDQARALFSRLEPFRNELKPRVAAGALDAVPAEMLPESFVRQSFPADARIGCSFAFQMWAQTLFRSDLKRENGNSIEFLINDKRTAYEFADILDLPRTQVHQRNVALKDVRIAPRTVIKPARGAGARGVFCVMDPETIRIVANRRILTSVAELHAEAERLLAARGLRDAWIVEDLVTDDTGSPAHDLKFYCFYGRAPVVLEVDRNGPKVRYCWWGRDAQRLETGKYENALFEGTPVPDAFFDIAEAVSARIPAPFMRIDFLRGRDGLVFSEFTPRPGAFHEFGLEFDRILGREFVRAQARLFNDIYHGREFPEFSAIAAAPPRTPASPGRAMPALSPERRSR